MIADILRQLLAPAPTRLPDTDARLAMAALLVRLARTDGLYSAEEVERIDRVLMRRFDLGPFEVVALRAEAEALEVAAPDTVRFTKALKEAVAVEDRTGLLQALWSVALADGLRDADEDRLMRLVAGLLGLTDVESALARRRAEAESAAE
ncbi:MAG: TerB family tellurite resistance protein [Paracoccaceae bacterium]